MWVVGRILIVIVTVIGILLVAAGTATLVGADVDSLTDRIDDINIDPGNFIGGGDWGVALGDPGIFIGVEDGRVALGVILLGETIKINLRPSDL